MSFFSPARAEVVKIYRLPTTEQWDLCVPRKERNGYRGGGAFLAVAAAAVKIKGKSGRIMIFMVLFMNFRRIKGQKFTSLLSFLSRSLQILGELKGAHVTATDCHTFKKSLLSPPWRESALSLIPANKESKWPKPKKSKKWGGERKKWAKPTQTTRKREKTVYLLLPTSVSLLPPQLCNKQQCPPSSLVWWRGVGGKKSEEEKRGEDTQVSGSLVLPSSLVYTTNIYFSSSFPGHSRIYAESENAFPCTYKICSARLLLLSPGDTAFAQRISPKSTRWIIPPPPTCR